MRIKKISTLAGNKILDFKTLWSWNREDTGNGKRTESPGNTHTWSSGEWNEGRAVHSKRKGHRVNGARKMGDAGNDNTVFLSHTILKFYLTPERVKCQVPSLEHLIMRTSF